MIELSMLKAFLSRHNFQSYRELLNPKTLSRQSIQILKDIEVYFELRTIHIIDINDFSVYFFNVRNPYLDDKAVLEYKEIFKLLEELDNTEEIEQLIQGFKQQVLYEDLKRSIEQNKPLEELELKLEEFKTEKKKEDVEELFPDMNIHEAAEFVDRSKGLKWRCKALQDYFEGGVIQSDFIIIAGFVGAGKSTFLASELSYMATQLENEDDYVLWLSNEGSYKTALTRLYCASLNSGWKQIDQNKQKAEDLYIKKMNGNKNRIRILDIQGWTAKQIENLIKKKPPKLLAIDLVDNIRGFDKFLNQESSWELYARLYQWCRELATKYCPVLGVSQLSKEGENNMYPSSTQLRGSKIDKSAACTALLTIGSIIGDNTTRYLSFPKTKLRPDINDWKATVKVDMLRSRYL